jgi:hypothetical protein
LRGRDPKETYLKRKKIMAKKDLGPRWTYYKNDPNKHLAHAAMYVALRQDSEHRSKMRGFSRAARRIMAEAPDLGTLAQYVAIGPFAPIQVPRIDLRYAGMRSDATGTLAHIQRTTPPLLLLNDLLYAPVRKDLDAYGRFVRRIEDTLTENGAPMTQKEFQTLRFRCLMYHFYRTALLQFKICNLSGMSLLNQNANFWKGFIDRIVKPIYLLRSMGPGYLLHYGDIRNVELTKIPKRLHVDEIAHAWLWHMAGPSADTFTASPGLNEVIENVGAKLSRNELPVLADCFPSEHPLSLSLPECFQGKFFQQHHAAACILLRIPRDTIKKLLGLSDEEYREILHYLDTAHPEFVKRPVACPPFVGSAERSRKLKWLLEENSPLAQLSAANARLAGVKTPLNRLQAICLLIYHAQRVPCLFLAADPKHLSFIQFSESRTIRMFNSLSTPVWDFPDLDESILKMPLKELQALYEALMSSDGRSQALVQERLGKDAPSIELIEIIGSILDGKKVGMFGGAGFESDAARFD